MNHNHYTVQSEAHNPYTVQSEAHYTVQSDTL